MTAVGGFCIVCPFGVFRCWGVLIVICMCFWVLLFSVSVIFCACCWFIGVFWVFGDCVCEVLCYFLDEVWVCVGPGCFVLVLCDCDVVFFVDYVSVCYDLVLPGVGEDDGVWGAWFVGY